MTSGADPLVLIGPMGAGKTSIGRRVAKELQVPFIDTDAVIVREHGPIAEIFARAGEEEFRRIEREAVRTSLASDAVVSLGGGAILHPDTRAELAAHRVVLLTVDASVVASRVGGGGRPLLQGDDAAARWSEIYESRRPIYEELASVTFDTSRGPLRDVVAAVAEWARATPGATPAWSRRSDAGTPASECEGTQT